ncbi:MAG: dethiobiotin synthase [Sulfuricella sp.]|nr:dethiobiotin synthase [Sulfuricella sp.]
MKRAYFVTGTDTGVGKTLVSCALLRAFAARGMTAVGMKPVAAGCEPHENGLCCEDVENLVAAGTVAAPREWVNPYAFEPPVAPHIAAAQAGMEMDLGQIESAFRKLQNLADLVIVEGVGGFRVPLNERQDTADLAVALNLPVILVVGMRLGCLNLALLTAEAIRARGLNLAGWVANRVDPDMPLGVENREALERRLGCPLLGDLPYIQSDEKTIAELHLRLDKLIWDT